MTAPDVAEIRAYAGWPDSQYSTAQINDALAAETVAQANVCKIPVTDPPTDPPRDLREALMRRVVRNLHMRAVPLGVQADEMGGIRIGTNDPEIRRLEGPYRKRRVG